MSPRDVLPTILLGILGIAAAAAIALAADSITGEEIGLTAEPVAVGDGGERLVEPRERRKERKDEPGLSAEEPVVIDVEGDGDGGDGEVSGGGGGTREIEPVEPQELEEPDSDNSGSDSDSSGSGSSGSGSGGNSGPGGGDD